MILINSSPKDALKIFQPFLPIFVPIGAGYLLAFAKEQNIKVKFIDEQIEDDVIAKAAEYAKDLMPPYIFAFSVLTASFKSAIKASQALKKMFPDSVILFGGIHPTAMPEETLAYRHIDAVIRGEAERELVEFYKCVKEKKDFTHIAGLSYKKDARIIHNPQAQEALDLEIIPDFPYYLFRSERYDLGFVVSSRGCPHRCIFCSNRVTTGKRYRYSSAKKIMHDLDWVYNQYLIKKQGKRNIQFLDDNLLVNQNRVYELLEEIKRAGFGKELTFSFQARGDNVNPKILKDLYDAGFKSVFFGLETASEKIMQLIKKDETVEQCIAAVKMAKQIGFHVSATFIYGFPSETHKDRMDCLKLSKELKLDMVRYNNATPYPGTEMYEMAKKDAGLQVIGLYENFFSTSTFIEYPFKEIPFSYVPPGSRETGIRNDLLLSYFVFYFDFNKIKSIFKNPEKNVGWFNAGETVLSLIKKLPALFLLGLNIFLKYYKLCISIVLGMIADAFFGSKTQPK